MNEEDAKKETRIFGLSRNVLSMGLVSLLNDLSSDMIFPFIPIFLTSVLGASVAFVGLVEGIADATASILKIISGSWSDAWRRRKPFVVFGYSFSALAKPLLAISAAPWHVLGVRFLDRVGKGMRDAPRDALISVSTAKGQSGRAFGFHRAADTLGASLGPLVAFLILPLLHNNLRQLFLLSFVASFFAIVVLAVYVREVRSGRESGPSGGAQTHASAPRRDAASFFRIRDLGAPFFFFLAAVTLLSLGRSSEAFLLLRARDVGVGLALLPIIYFVSNITFALLSTPAGILSDKIGHRNTFMIGMLVFSGVSLLFARVSSAVFIWFVFVLYGVFNALTEGVGRAIVADLVADTRRATAYGVYNGCVGVASLPASLVFGVLWTRLGSGAAFTYGATLGFAAFLVFSILRMRSGFLRRV